MLIFLLQREVTVEEAVTVEEGVMEEVCHYIMIGSLFPKTSFSVNRQISKNYIGRGRGSGRTIARTY